jgi:hypothetical protein
MRVSVADFALAGSLAGQTLWNPERFWRQNGDSGNSQSKIPVSELFPI